MIPNGYAPCEWSQATHVLSNGKVIRIGHGTHTVALNAPNLCLTLTHTQAMALGVTVLRELPRTAEVRISKDENVLNKSLGSIFDSSIRARLLTEGCKLTITFDTEENQS